VRLIATRSSFLSLCRRVHETYAYACTCVLFRLYRENRGVYARSRSPMDGPGIKLHSWDSVLKKTSERENNEIHARTYRSHVYYGALRFTVFLRSCGDRRPRLIAATMCGGARLYFLFHFRSTRARPAGTFRRTRSDEVSIDRSIPLYIVAAISSTPCVNAYTHILIIITRELFQTGSSLRLSVFRLFATPKTPPPIHSQRKTRRCIAAVVTFDDLIVQNYIMPESAKI